MPPHRLKFLKLKETDPANFDALYDDVREKAGSVSEEFFVPIRLTGMAKSCRQFVAGNQWLVGFLTKSTTRWGGR